MRPVRAKHLARGLLTALLLVTAASAASAAPVGEKVSFDSRNYEAIPELLIGRAYLDAKVQAYLSLPEAATGKVPAVVIVHDTFGVSDDEFDYAALLNAAGYATLVLDEYTDRRVRNRDDTFNATRTADGLNALRFLAVNPKIDRNRIAIIGFSRGGVAAYLSAIEPVRKSIMGSAPVRFAAHVAYYPVSPALIVGDTATFTTAPVRFFFGRDDTVAPVTQWLEYFAFLKNAKIGWEPEHEIYDGGHGFERSYTRRTDRTFLNLGRCPPVYYRLQGARAELFRLTAGKLVGITRTDINTASCAVPSGPIGRITDAARVKSREDLKVFLGRALAPQ
jgi:dienelactone hydrolase